MKMKDQNVMKGNIGGDGPRGASNRNASRGNGGGDNNERRAPPSEGGGNEGGRRPANNNEGNVDINARRVENLNRHIARNRQMDREEEEGGARSAEEDDQAAGRQYHFEDESQSNN